MSEKHSCSICGTRRQRNLVFFPHFFSGEFEKSLGNLPFLVRMIGDECTSKGDEYICYRCLELPKIRAMRSFDNRYARMAGEPEKPLYRYSDMDEAVLANRLKHKLS